jgi:hypothetical protein
LQFGRRQTGFFLFRLNPFENSFEGGYSLARKTVLVCDDCGTVVADNHGATMRVTFTDARRGSKVADLCDACVAKLPGRGAARRGRRPKSVA